MKSDDGYQILDKNDNFIKIWDNSVNEFYLFVKCGDFESHQQMQTCYDKNKQDFVKLAKFIQNYENLKDAAEKAGLDIQTVGCFCFK